MYMHVCIYIERVRKTLDIIIHKITEEKKKDNRGNSKLLDSKLKIIRFIELKIIRFIVKPLSARFLLFISNYTPWYRLIHLF